MKVLFVSSGNSEAGISPIVRSQGESLKRKGIYLDYFTILGKGTKGYLKNIPRLRNFLRTNNYELIHAHYGLCGVVSELSRKNEKLVVSFMGDDILSIAGSGGIFTKKSVVFAFINKILARFKYDQSIIKSRKMESRFIKNTNFVVLPNGVDFEIFFPIRQSIARNKIHIKRSEKIVLFVSDPNRVEKNFGLAKRAYELLNIENVKLKVLKNVDHNQLIWYYNAADVLMLTSFYEGSPNVIKEAMACNLSIVSTDVGDVREVTGKTEGTYITSFEHEDVAEKLQLALNFGKRTNGRKTIEGLRTDVIAMKLIRIYEEVLKGNPIRGDAIDE